MSEQQCETCGADAELFVYALPGIPMSVGNCCNCAKAGAYPLSVAIANTECIGGLEQDADWWLMPSLINRSWRKCSHEATDRSASLPDAG